MPAPHFPTVKKKARTRPLVRKPRQQRSAPIEARRRREGAAPVLGRINADAALHAGLGWARKPKPGLILRNHSQRTVRRPERNRMRKNAVGKTKCHCAKRGAA